ncbi:MAG: KOW domain-containing RNA-binding protein [Clostridia bacterium]|nr:KOW domain-containing RNA-binding protein [Clostridia bacterium]
MKKNNVAVGGVCKSTQGRDAGKYYIIKEVLANGYVLVSDGDCKKLAAPKKKSLKHLHILPEREDAIGDKLAAGARVFDSEIYSALKKYNAAQTTASDADAE